MDSNCRTGIELCKRVSFGCIPLRNGKSQLYISRGALGRTAVPSQSVVTYVGTPSICAQIYMEL